MPTACVCECAYACVSVGVCGCVRMRACLWWVCRLVQSSYMPHNETNTSEDLRIGSTAYANPVNRLIGETGGNCNIFHIFAHYVEHVFY